MPFEQLTKSSCRKWPNAPDKMDPAVHYCFYILGSPCYEISPSAATVAVRYLYSLAQKLVLLNVWLIWGSFSWKTVLKTAADTPNFIKMYCVYTVESHI